MGVLERSQPKAYGFGGRSLPVADAGPSVPGWVARAAARCGAASRGFMPGVRGGTSWGSKNVGAERLSMRRDGVDYRAASATKRSLLYR